MKVFDLDLQRHIRDYFVEDKFSSMDDLEIKAKDFIDACYKKGLILVQAAGEKTIRIAPSLIISDKEIEEGFKRFEMAIKTIK